LKIDYSRYIERTLADGRFESEFINYFRAQIGEWEHFVDVGANIGFFSLLVQKQVSGCRVDAFEPLPRNVNRILTNEQLNGAALNVHAVALAESYAVVPLNVSDELPGETSISKSLRSGSVTRTIETVTAPLDDVLEESPDAMKIDIEGAEVQMLRGATDLLSSTPDLFLELHPSNISDLGESLTALVDVLTAAGYSSVRHVENDEVIEVPALEDIEQEHQHFHIT